MLENIAAAPAQPKNAGVFTVIWQGINDTSGSSASTEYEDVKTFSTEVVPGQYGYLDVDDISEEEWGAIACGEQFDGSNEFDTIDVLFVIDGGVIVQLEGKDS